MQLFGRDYDDGMSAGKFLLDREKKSDTKLIAQASLMTTEALHRVLAALTAPNPEGTLPEIAEKYERHAYMIKRELLGRRVRDVWISWAREQFLPKKSWLKQWQDLTEPEREVDRRIGETLYFEGLHDAIV